MTGSGDADQAASRAPAQRHSCEHCETEIISYEKYARDHFDSWTYELRHTIAEAYRAAAARCPFFEWICEQITKSETPEEQLTRTKIRLNFTTRPGNPDDMFSVGVLLSTDKYSWSVHGFSVVSEHDDPSADYAVGRSIEGSVMAPNGVRQLRRRLGECLLSHKDCPAQTPHNRPPRFIDVQSSGSDVVRIVSPDLTRLDPYTALSYCWGGPQSVKTTLSSLASYEAGITIASLPQTLQDAIRVTREIGVRYLWVDSLCIVQDSPDEVAKEVANMSHYYGNALVTLSAAAAPSCAKGFLTHRSRPHQNLCGPFYFPIQPVGRNRRGHIKLVFLVEDVEVLETRAWTLQESILSTRLVSFGASSIRWSCRTISYEQPRNSNSTALRSELTNIRNSASRRMKAGSNMDWVVDNMESYTNELHTALFPKQNRWLAMKLWYDIVANYTSRTLSVGEDKFSAISGIAREFASMLIPPRNRALPNYLAGLWISSHIGLQLLWMPRGVGQRHEAYIAPSWSWASIQGPVDVGFCLDSQNETLNQGFDELASPSNEARLPKIFQLVDAEVSLLSPEAPYGPLQSASITIEGKAVSGSIETLSDLGIRVAFDTSDDDELARAGLSLTCVQVIARHQCDKRLLEKPERIDGLPKGLVLIESDNKTFRRAGVYFQPYFRADGNENSPSWASPREQFKII